MTAAQPERDLQFRYPLLVNGSARHPGEPLHWRESVVAPYPVLHVAGKRDEERTQGGPDRRDRRYDQKRY